jgi:colicin import membrane protein
MATKKRTSSRSRLLKRAVKAGRSYLRQAERRLPPDVRKQIDRSIKDGQKKFEGALKQLRTRLDRTASQVDMEKALKRLDGLSKQVQAIARSATARPAAPTPTRRAARRPAASRRTTRAAAPKAAAPAKAATRKAPVRRAASRRRASSSPTVMPATVESPSMAIPDPSPREPAG